MSEPESGARPLIIAHISRWGRSRYPEAVAETLATDVTKAGPALTVLTASRPAVRPGEPPDAHDAFLERVPGPYLALQREHEVRRQRWGLLGMPGRIRPDIDPVVQTPGVRALGLRPVPRWWSAPGRVTSGQSAAVTEVLGDAPMSTLRLLALGHPPPLGVRSPLSKALADARVELLIAAGAQVPSVRRIELPVEGRAHRLVAVVAGPGHPSSLSWCLICVDPITITVQERHLLDSGWHAGRTVRYSRLT